MRVTWPVAAVRAVRCSSREFLRERWASAGSSPKLYWIFDLRSRVWTTWLVAHLMVWAAK